MDSLNRSTLRKLLNEVLRSDSDLNAFCGDYFPEVYQRFTGGMDRQSKVTLLLDHADLSKVESMLRRAFPVEFADKRGGRQDVVQGVPAPALLTRSARAEPDAPPSRPIPGTSIARIFRTSGQPEYNFVEPAQSTELKIRLRMFGEGLLVEGPSGVGKTTAVDRALQDLGERERTIWLSALSEPDCTALDELIRTDFQRGGQLVIDDFHRMDPLRQQKLTSLIKILSDRNRHDAKVTLIGVNPIGASLLAYNPDAFGRFAGVTMGKQPDAKVDELIRKGESVANLKFNKRGGFVAAAAGSFVIAQRLCLEAALSAGVFEVTQAVIEIEEGPEAVTKNVHQDLAARFRAQLGSFAAFDERPPPRGACLLLLWHLSQTENACVSIDELRYRYWHLTPAFEWLMASNLAGLFERNSGMSHLLFYNRNAAVLSAEDTQLQFYLRHLDWADFATENGHPIERWDATKGPVFKAGSTEHTASAGAQRQVHVPVSATIEAKSGVTGTLSVASQDPVSTSILHLSDLHFGTQPQAIQWYNQLAADLKYELSLRKLNAVIVSGDISHHAEQQEYQAAQRFFQELIQEFGLLPQRVILVPGNHDVSWTLSEKAYTPVRRKSYKGSLVEGMYIDGGDYVELRSEVDYRERFRPFAELYQAVRMEPYPLDFQDQATVHHLLDDGLVVLGLNSAWALDHHFTTRAGIHHEALSRALTQIRNTSAFGSCLKLAVWHHPLFSDGEDRIKDNGFLEQLAQAGFRLGLHGHVHKADNTLYRYYRPAGGSRGGGIELLCAGTFGAPTREWVPGYPLQYQVLQLTAGKLVVHTRRREELNGAWKPDARWLQGSGKDPLPRYEIDLSP